jgi:hypothetical protein
MARKKHLAVLIPHHCILWFGRVFTILVMLVIGGLSGGLWWLQQFHGPDAPVDLSGLAPQLEKLLGGGVSLQVGGAEIYYDHGIMLRADNLWLRGADGTLAVVVESAAVRFSGLSLWQLKVAPRSLEASNVTLRLVRSDDHISIAGLNVGGAGKAPGAGAAGLGVVAWLNGLGLNDTWGWLRNVRVTDLTLLLRDDVKHTEWIVQDANVEVGRAAEGGEHGSLVAEVRRVGADGKERKLPVMLTFDHTENADTADLRARFGSTDLDLVADYLPPQVSDMIKAQGTVEVGTTLGRDNKLGQPWITLGLRDVAFAAPPGFGHGLKFDRLKLTASYQASPTDLLTLHDVEAEYKGLNTLHAKGWVQGLANTEAGSNPQASVVVYSTGGLAQKFFDFMPDKRMDIAMGFLRKNISSDARINNVVLTYTGHPQDFPFCGDNCGLVIRGDMVKGQAKFADELPPISNVSGTFVLKGDGLYFVVAPSPMGPQATKDVRIALTHLFVPGPTLLAVNGTVAGPLPDLLKNLEAWMKHPMPMVTAGTHSTQISFTLPFQEGHKTDFVDATVDAESNIQNADVQKVPDLPVPPVKVADGLVRIGGGKLALNLNGSMSGQTLNANLTDAIATFGANLKGSVHWTAPSDATLTMDGSTLTLTGKKLDLSAYDLDSLSTSDTTVKNMNVNVKLDQLKTREANLTGVTAQLAANAGKWEIHQFTAKVEGNPVSVVSTNSADGRRKLNVNIENTGQLLRGLGLYKDLRDGRLAGEINYDSPDVGAGVLQMKHFELANPPVLVRLLGLLSLPQLIAGTDSVLFDKASIPLRLDHDFVYLDNVTMEGPSMSLRLNGSYNRVTKTLDIDGNLAPAIPFNRLVSKIPLLGTILTGSQDGVVVADFSLKGSSDAPDISVHPLSVLTPGLLKDVFNGMGGKPQPRPQVIDGRSKQK